PVSWGIVANPQGVCLVLHVNSHSTRGKVSTAGHSSAEELMAIPLTCPGCKAAFEVPDHLAGKTIRCTACKTQLTVAAPAPAEAVAAAPPPAKKPFGWAGANSGSQPAAEPLPLDDDTKPPSKTNPAEKAPPAKAAPKPAVKSDVTVDDDEEKTNPSKKS